MLCRRQWQELAIWTQRLQYTNFKTNLNNLFLTFQYFFVPSDPFEVIMLHTAHATYMLQSMPLLQKSFPYGTCANDIRYITKNKTKKAKLNIPNIYYILKWQKSIFDLNYYFESHIILFLFWFLNRNISNRLCATVFTWSYMVYVRSISIISIHHVASLLKQPQHAIAIPPRPSGERESIKSLTWHTLLGTGLMDVNGCYVKIYIRTLH
jgi:hypothetical protein